MNILIETKRTYGVEIVFSETYSKRVFFICKKSELEKDIKKYYPDLKKYCIFQVI